MTLHNTKPLRFSPQGLSDALAEEDAFPGACSILTNLIPDPTTKNLWTPRPASVSLTTFGGFISPTGVPVFKIVGSYVYGLVSTGRTAGKDEPFCFNLLTNTFVTVTGITSANVPTTQPTTGDWTPPTMDVVGTNLIVTHPGFDGVTNFIGWFDTTNLATPIWNAGNFKLVNPILTVIITNAGTGYTNGTYNNVPLIGGRGSGATANIVVAGGVVSTVTLVKTGVGYVKGDSLTAATSSLGGTGSNFGLLVTAVVGAAISDIIFSSGSFPTYNNGTFFNVSLYGGQGTGAAATIIVTGQSVVGVTITNPGSGYVIGDQLTFSGAVMTFTALVGGSGYSNGTYFGVPLNGGTGDDVTATLTVAGGAVTSATIVNPGGAYTPGDTLNLLGNGVTGVTLTNAGSGLSPGTVVNVSSVSTSGGGDGATFTFIVGSTFVSAVLVEQAGFGYTVGDVLTFLYGIVLTVSSVSGTTTSIGSGTGFSINVNTVATSAAGYGGDFTVTVIGLDHPGGFINFTTLPSWVRQFNGRAWFGINPPTGIPSVIFSDVYALNATNANQALSFGDNTPLTAAATLGLANLLGGVVQSLIVFKSLDGIIQITGDATTNNLSVNQVPGGSGTISPRSLVEHPQGLLYLDHDGYRMVTLDGNCTDPIGVAGQGVVVPFLNLPTPTRVAAGCNGSILRVSVNTVMGPWQEFWFDTVRKVWSGPHTFPATMMDVYQDQFILAAQSAPVGLFNSAITPYPGEGFVENGTPLTWTYQTVVLMDNMQMAQSEIAEMQIKTSSVTGTPSVVVSILENSATLATTTYSYAATGIIAARRIAFTSPVVYNRIAIAITGSSYAGFRIGDVFVKARELGYMQEYA